MRSRKHHMAVVSHIAQDLESTRIYNNLNTGHTGVWSLRGTHECIYMMIFGTLYIYNIYAYIMRYIWRILNSQKENTKLSVIVIITIFELLSYMRGIQQHTGIFLRLLSLYTSWIDCFVLLWGYSVSQSVLFLGLYTHPLVGCMTESTQQLTKLSAST